MTKSDVQSLTISAYLSNFDVSFLFGEGRRILRDPPLLNSSVHGRCMFRPERDSLGGVFDNCFDFNITVKMMAECIGEVGRVEPVERPYLENAQEQRTDQTDTNDLKEIELNHIQATLQQSSHEKRKSYGERTASGRSTLSEKVGSDIVGSNIGSKRGSARQEKSEGSGIGSLDIESRRGSQEKRTLSSIIKKLDSIIQDQPEETIVEALEHLKSVPNSGTIIEQLDSVRTINTQQQNPPTQRQPITTFLLPKSHPLLPYDCQHLPTYTFALSASFRLDVFLQTCLSYAKQQYFQVQPSDLQKVRTVGQCQLTLRKRSKRGILQIVCLTVQRHLVFQFKVTSSHLLILPVEGVIILVKQDFDQYEKCIKDLMALFWLRNLIHLDGEKGVNCLVESLNPHLSRIEQKVSHLLPQNELQLQAKFQQIALHRSNFLEILENLRLQLDRHYDVALWQIDRRLIQSTHLFSDYVRCFQKQEQLYQEKRKKIISSWSFEKCFDYLEVTEQYRLRDNQHPTDNPYQLSVDEFHRLDNFSEPIGKLGCLVRAFNLLQESCLDYHNGLVGLQTMDNILPVLIFVVLHTELKNSYANIKLCQHYVELCGDTTGTEARILTNIFVQIFHNLDGNGIHNGLMGTLMLIFYHLMLSRRIVSGISSLRSLILSSDHTTLEPRLALRQFHNNQDLISLHVALGSVYKNINMEGIAQEVMTLKYLLSRQSDRRKFSEVVLQKALPFQQNPILKQLYFQEVDYYFSETVQYNQRLFFSVVESMNRLLFGLNQLKDKEGEDEKEVVRDATKHFLTRYTQNLDMFDLRSKLKMVRICKNLKISNPQFLQNCRWEVMSHSRSMMLEDVLLVLAYLQDNKCLPYEMFYDCKDRWWKMIDCFDGHLPRKSQPVFLRMFEILSKSRLPYIWHILQKILNMIENRIEQFDTQQIIRILYYYSKLKTKRQAILMAIVVRLRKDVKELSLTNMKYLLVSMGNLNFNDLKFFKVIQKNEYFTQAMVQVTKDIRNPEYYDELLKVLKENPETV